MPFSLRVEEREPASRRFKRLLVRINLVRRMILVHSSVGIHGDPTRWLCLPEEVRSKRLLGTKSLMFAVRRRKAVLI